MKFFLNTLLAAGIVSAQTVGPYGQCGGLEWDYSWECETGYTCSPVDADGAAFPNYQCLPNTGPVITHVFPYGQCGGQGYTGPTICTPGWTCIVNSPYFSQCFTNATIVNIPNPTPNLAVPGNFCGSSAMERDQATDCVPGYTCSGPGVFGYYVCLLDTSSSSSSSSSPSFSTSIVKSTTISTQTIRTTSKTVKGKGSSTKTIVPTLTVRSS